VFPLKDDIPTRRFPVVTVAIIAINVLVFFLFQKAHLSGFGFAVDDANTVEYGAIPYELTHPGDHCALTAAGEIACEGQGGVQDSAPDQAPSLLTPFSSMFMHGGLLHIAGNMLFLWIFGNNVEDSMGRIRFVAFYLLAGLLALGVQTLVDPSSTAPTIGASGAVAGVLGAYALLYPRARVVTLIIIIFFITIVELPALLVLGVWFLLQVLYGASDLGQPLGGSGGVAYFAHIGGFVFGLIAIKLFANDVHDDYDRPQRIPVY
jgi:membrane associated rhomboid family serine protease